MPLKILLVVILLAIPLVPTFWAILDIPRRRFPTRGRKILWFVVVATFPFIGCMFYIMFARRGTEPLEG